jgi:ubiquinone/menaquinone biosynthesis C-methylase UbiE
METIAAEGPNAEQIKFWNDDPAQRWVEAQAALDAQLNDLGRRTMDAAGLDSDARVIDVGCGCGATTLEMARRVGTKGFVTGVDVSMPMLTQARRAAAEGKISNVAFINADAQTHAFTAGSVEVLFSRFGVMFFADPRAAFANLHRALTPDGRLAFVCWRSFLENPWMAVPMMAALQHVTLPPPPPPDAPGPFAFADADRVRAILADAGFANVRVDPVDETLTVGGRGGLDQAVSFLLQIGPTARALREVDPGVLPRVTEAVRAALEPYYTPAGVRMLGAAWLVTAKKQKA